MLIPGQTIGKYIVEAQVGEGGLARVYRVRHATLDTRFALKLLAIRGGTVQRRLVREGRIQAALNHPHVVSVMDVIDHEGHPGLVMEYVEGLSLDRVLAHSGALPIDAALQLGAQVLAAVLAAHQREVLHRDLKPGNVMLQPVTGGSRAKVTDFGIARLMAANDGDTLQGDFLGTPGFMAPEQVSDPAGVDRRADIYSLGALIYCMVCGRPPFPPGTSLVETIRAAARGEFPSVRELRSDCPAAVAEVIESCLAADPSQRPDSIEVLGERLFADQPELLKVLGGHAGVADITLPSLPPQPTPVSLKPITNRPVSDTGAAPSVGGGATAVPEDLFDGQTYDFLPADTSAGPPSVHTATTERPEEQEPGPGPRLQAPASSDVAPRALFAALALLVVGVGAWSLWDAPARTPLPEEPRVTAPAPGPTPRTDAPEATAQLEAPPKTEAALVEGATAPAAPTTGPQAAPPEAPAPTAPPPASPTPKKPTPPPEAPPTPVDPEPAPADPGSEPDPGPAPETEPAPTASEPSDPAPAASESNDATADASLEVEEAPPPAAPPLPVITGTWKGSYGKRPLTLSVRSQQEERISASFVVNSGGTSRTTVTLSGTLQADGRLSLTDPRTGWTVEGTIRGDALDGTIQHPRMNAPEVLRVQRR